jgi:hypothetical protein
MRNVRNLGPRGLKVSICNVLLEGLYRLDGQLRPRGLSSVYYSIEGLVRAEHMLLRSGMSDDALLHPTVDGAGSAMVEVVGGAKEAMLVM